MITPDDLPRIDAMKMNERRKKYGWPLEMIKAGFGLFVIVHGTHWVFTVVGALVILNAVSGLLLPWLVKSQSALARKVDPDWDEQKIFFKLGEDRKLKLHFQKGMMKGALDIDPPTALDLADKLRFYAENIQGTQAYAETQESPEAGAAEEPTS